MKDIRRQRRIPLITDAKIIKLSSGDRADAKLINISNYGASLKTTVPLKANERIKLSMTLTKQYHAVQTEEVPGIARHVERTKGNYLAGIKFDIKINDTEYPRFNQCLEYLKTHE